MFGLIQSLISGHQQSRDDANIHQALGRHGYTPDAETYDYDDSNDRDYCLSKWPWQ